MLRKPTRILLNCVVVASLGLAVGCADEDNDGGDDNDGSGATAAATGGGTGTIGGTGTGATSGTGGTGGSGNRNTGGSGNVTSTGGTSGTGGSGASPNTRRLVAPCVGIPFDQPDPTGGSGGTGEATGGIAGEPVVTGGVAGELTDQGGIAGVVVEPTAGGVAGEPTQQVAGGAAGESTEVTAGVAGADDKQGDDRGSAEPKAEDDERGTCVGTSMEIERMPVDIFILMDRTISQSYAIEQGSDTSRWEAMLEAVRLFAVSDEIAHVNAGIVFVNAHGTGREELECNVEDYATPVVPMQPMAVAGPQIIAEMENLQPSGMTPLVPAVTGAMQYAKEWAADHPDSATALVLVGDGYPTICDDQDPSDVADVVRAGWQTNPPVRTYAVGVGASSELNLNVYATAGGTFEAVMTDESGVTEGFLNVLLNIASSNIPCDFGVPDAPSDIEEVDFTEVSVVYYPFSGDPWEVPAVEGPSRCNGEYGGWYYDNPNDPTEIQLCPCSCSAVGAGRLEAKFDCRPKPPIL